MKETSAERKGVLPCPGEIGGRHAEDESGFAGSSYEAALDNKGTGPPSRPQHVVVTLLARRGELSTSVADSETLFPRLPGCPSRLSSTRR